MQNTLNNTPTQPWVSTDQIRADFADAMSQMYQKEVPLYGELLELVQKTNQDYLDLHNEMRQTLERTERLDNLNLERHGAIRLGSAQELHTMRRLFAVMGMYPVDYYDLGVTGIPVHSTAFRPLSRTALQASPFRIFTSLLRLDLIKPAELRQQARDILEQRQIFSDEALALIEVFEQQGGLDQKQADVFIPAALEIFRWHPQAQVDKAVYQQLHNAHRLIADVVSFRGPHINHLTPRTLNIDHAQQAMLERGIQAKAVVEGPPARKNGILLRQTSFKALNETTVFSDDQQGGHTARFGEIEQRGIALTPKGRALYDRLLNQVRDQVPNPEQNPEKYQQVLKTIFAEFPDDLGFLRQQALAYFEYQLNQPLPKAYQSTETLTNEALESLIEQGIVTAIPITYEDFLPVSAAGIFQSNLGDEQQQLNSTSSREQFEDALGCSVHDPFQWYEQIQQDSIQQLSINSG